MKSGRQVRGNILDRVHRKLCPAVGKRRFQFLYEKPFPPGLVEASFQELIPPRRHGEELDFESGMERLQARAHMLRLPEREPTAARSDDELHRAILVTIFSS